MPINHLLVANRGEIAIRILRAAAELGIATTAVHSEDDARSLHVRRADRAHALRGRGAAAYLDIEQIVAAARSHGCDAVHPGYGFLSESPQLATRCAESGICFVGPSPETLTQLGDKTRARDRAVACGVATLAGTKGPTSVGEARTFLNSLGADGAVMVKAVNGGGGRGMRPVRNPDALDDAFERCASEALRAFGDGALYVEELLSDARHIEVQIVGDGRAVSHLGERECTLQRRHQKLVELTPSPTLPDATRRAIHDAAVQMATALGYHGIGTFEFLVSATSPDRFAFIEANPRLQVEHTVTEAVTGVDLVATQLALASGRSLDDLGLEQANVPPPRGFAVQARVNMESIGAGGMPRPSSGTLSAYEIPSGPGVRVDGCGYAGYKPSPFFDSLLAKVIGHSPAGGYADALVRTERALAELRVEGIETNTGFLRALLRHPDVIANRVTTSFVDDRAEELAASAPDPSFTTTPAVDDDGPIAGARIDRDDPLAVLDHGRSSGSAADASQPAASAEGSPDRRAVRAPVQGTVASIDVAEGDTVRPGDTLCILEAMKMEHVVAAECGGTVLQVAVRAGDTVPETTPLLFLEERKGEARADVETERVDLDHIRPDLLEVRERHRAGMDEARPAAVARRRKTGQRTTRENVDDLCDPDSFVEYGALVIAAQRRRRSIEDLVANTPADGLVAGVGTVNGDLFDDVDARCVVMSYDYTVLAGTQGLQNHRKKDRMFELAEEWRLPLVFLTEGGGGRPGDTDGSGVAGLDCWAFHDFGRLSGLVPLVGINSGRCFAGNAALLGCCDVVIATEDSNIGMGGPAMIEGGGLGIFRPDEVGPMSDQVPNGVVDIAVADEAEAVAVAKRYLSYFQGALPADAGACADQRRLRSAIPENRLRIYDVRKVIELLADSDSVLELRPHFGLGMVTALARIEGRPIGIVANNPTHLAGAIDREGADKASRFMQLCDAFDIPMLFLCDTPGIMVGPDSERTALVRHASRMFVTGANLSVPIFTIVLRKGYGLGAQAMAGGSFKAPFFTVSWPTGEFGGMGLEGAVKLGYRKELEAVEDPEERRALYQQMVDRMYEHGKATSMASYFEIDDVIDPADSRKWVARGMRSAPPPPPRTGKKRPMIDTW